MCCTERCNLKLAYFLAYSPKRTGQPEALATILARLRIETRDAHKELVRVLDLMGTTPSATVMTLTPCAWEIHKYAQPLLEAIPLMATKSASSQD